MNITEPGSETYIGGSQEWYEVRWHKISGCGPIAASNLIWYTSRMQGDKSQYEILMREMYSFMTPGMHGVNTSKIFTDAVSHYGAEKGMQMNLQVLEIPKKVNLRPDITTTLEFIASALHSNQPIAFLNLSNGTVKNLENWHWVTIITLDKTTGIVEVSDYGKKLDIDISEWLKTTKLGGSLVTLSQNPTIHVGADGNPPAVNQRSNNTITC